jgi:hypothetical protein
MRVFITFAAGESYERLAEVLKDSIETFSEYDLIVYKPEDFDYKLNTDSPYQITVYKILSSIKSLELYDEVTWLDTDCLVTKNIDKIWNNKADGYPLLPSERFNNFHIWPNDKQNCQDVNFLRESKERIGVVDNDFNNSYLQSCCMVMNKSCIPFLDEVISYYDVYDNNTYPYGDESIINCMIWRDKLPNNLGDVFLCSHYFSPYIIEAVLKSKTPEEYNNLFDINHRIADNEDSFILSHGWSLARHNRIGLVNNNFDNLLFLHGSKSADLHRNYLNKLKEWIDTSEK